MDHTVHILVLMSLWMAELQAKNKNNSTESGDFRLVGGASRCHGDLEMKQQDENWKPVSGSNWNLKSGNRVCSELDCGSAVSIRRQSMRFSDKDVWLIRPDCDESSLSTCFTSSIYVSSSLELTCSDSVRLVHGSSLCSGRLEVQSNQSWSSVCEGHFDLHDAQVVCRELGCGAPSVLQGALYGEAEAPLWKVFQCEGHESALLDCGSSVSDTCSSEKAVELTCSDPDDVRLVGGASRCDGKVQMKHYGEWGDIQIHFWTLKEAAVICRQLDCGSAVFVKIIKRDSSHPVWYMRSSCVQSTSPLRDCVINDDSTYSSLFLSCSDSVRLVHGSSLCSGRLEVQSNQSWSSVCEGHFDLHDAQVVCRELGCGAPSVLQGMLYGETEAPLWKAFQCEGHESALLDCESSVSDTCSSEKAVELTCSDPVDVRLVGEASRCNGSVQMNHHGEWRDLVYYLHSPWTLKEAALICRRLDCGSVVSAVMTEHGSSVSVWHIVPSCVQSPSSLRDCVADDYLSHSTLFLTCSDSVRLVHGSSLCSGRLEVRSNQSWSSVCEGYFDLHDAQVVCRELGCGAPLVLQGALYGEGEAPVWTSELQCEGNESALLDCRRSSSAGKTCSPGKAAGLTCTDPVRLMGQPSRCAGTLEIQLQGQWRPVGDHYKDWDLKFGSAACQHLDCGSAVSMKTRDDSSSRPVWFVSRPCVELTSGLRDCVNLYLIYKHTSSVEVVCSDLLPQPNISLSPSTEEVSEVYLQGFRVLMGSDFTVTCSIEPHYPGGSFRLTSDTSEPQNLSELAVNHSAHFLFSAAGHTHRGNYTCVYHVDVFNQNFSSSQSRALYLTVGASVTDLVFRVLVTVLSLIIFDIVLFFCYKVSTRRLRRQ